ncbi:MAG: hypothetical protein JW913_18365 [Chitinispirillaceae bacterium]|nr:hypothetical protein [Chitinispirillaceae bacterium]
MKTSNEQKYPDFIFPRLKYLCALCVSVVNLLFPLPALSLTPLSGDIHDHVFTADENPYVVSDNIIIPSGRKCTIPAGCVFIFQPFTGLTVEGTLIVKGTFEQPVVFSSANDTLYNPGSPQPANPFDWNGIVIAAESYGTLFEHARIRYSVYGIKSQTPNLTITRCLFSQNGQYHITIKNQIQTVLENFVFSYPLVDTVKVDSTLMKPDIGNSPDPKPERKNLKTVIRIGTLIMGVLGIAGGAVLYTMVKKADREIDSMKPWTINPETGDYYTGKEIEDADDRRKLLSAGSIGGFVLGGLGMAGFAVMWAF